MRCLIGGLIAKKEIVLLLLFFVSGFTQTASAKISTPESIVEALST